MISFPSKAAVDTIDEVLKVVAVVVGASWTYLNYARGRTFRTRLEVTLQGSAGRDGQFFLGECIAKNVGLSKIPLRDRGTAASVFALWLRTKADGSHRLVTEEVFVLPLFERHQWIEPGESISEPIAIALPKAKLPLMGVRLSVRISSGKTAWSASRIFEYVKPKPEAPTAEKTV